MTVLTPFPPAEIVEPADSEPAVSEPAVTDPADGEPAVSEPGPSVATPTGPLGRGVGRLGRWLTLPRVLLLIGLAIWGCSLPALRHATVSQWGLLVAGGPGLIVAALLVVGSFAVAIRRAALADAAAALLGFIVVTRLTASLSADLPLYTWTFKHIGVIDHLMTTRSLASGVDIYNSWPGLFSGVAWFCSVSGLSPITLAHWFAVGADGAIALGMYAVSRAFGQSRQVALVAAFGIQLLNWVGQDYLSPQAVAFALALGAIALLLRSRERPALAWLSLPLFVAIVVTHQLTPYWLCGVAVVLGLTGRIRPRYIGFVYAAIVIAFTVPHLSYLASQFGLLSGFDPLANAHSNITTPGNAGRDLTSIMAKVPSLLLWLSTGVIAVYRLRRRQPVLVPVVLAFLSFALLAGQSYGGEAIFRVYLYSIPGCLLLVAPAVTSGLTNRRGSCVGRRLVPRVLTRCATSATVILTVVALVSSMQAYYGTWFTNVVASDGLAAEQHLLATASTDSLVLPLTTGIAERPTGRYADFARRYAFYDSAIVMLPGVVGSTFDRAGVANLTTTLASTGHPVYVIITEQMRRYSDYYGQFPAGAVDRLTAALLTSSDWTTQTHTATLSIFRLRS